MHANNTGNTHTHTHQRIHILCTTNTFTCSPLSIRMTNQNPKLPQFSSNSSAPHKHNQAQTLTWPVKQHMACQSQQHSNHHDPEGSNNTYAKCTQTYFWLNTCCTAAFEMFANNNKTRAMQWHSSENDRNTPKQKTNRDHIHTNQDIPDTRTNNLNRCTQKHIC